MDIISAKETTRQLSQSSDHHKIDCVAERDDLVHSCYHGSSCIDASNEFGLLDKYCECDTANKMTAGLMCQYRPTSFCTTGEVSKAQITDQFCVNGGVCSAYVGAGENHPGCICETGKWEGKHCEFEHGVLFDDALDLFQQRKIEIRASQKLEGSGDLRTTIKLDGDGGNATEGVIPLPYLVGGIVTFFGVSFAVIKMSMLAIRNSRRDERTKDNDYTGIRSVSSRTTKMSNGSSLLLASLSPKSKDDQLPPPDVFLASRKKEVDPNEETSFILSPGLSTPGHDIHENDDGDTVEMLDAETSRMIEAQFSQGGGEMSDDGDSFESDNESEDGTGLQNGRITINQGKDPLSRLHSSSSEVSVYGHEECSLEDHVNKGKCIRSLDGEYDDEDENNYYV